MINNWMKRQSLIIRDPQKLVIPKQATHGSFSQWGKHVRQPTTEPTPTTVQGNSNTPTFINSKQLDTTLRKYKKETYSPSKSKGKTLGLPKNLRGKTLTKTIQQETETDNRVRAYVDRSLIHIPQIITTCTTCKTRKAKRIWKDPILSYLCAPCRTEIEITHPLYNIEVHNVSCVHCGTHNSGSKPWLHPPFLDKNYAICSSCRPPVGAKITTSPPPIICRRTNPANCEACACPFNNKKRYHRKEITLCHACYSTTSSKTHVEYALARFQVREAGFLPFSVSELKTHDRIIYETITRIKELTSEYKTLTEDQVTNLLAYLQHQTVTRYLTPTPSASALQRAALTISNLNTQTDDPETLSKNRHECPFCASIIETPSDRINHKKKTSETRFEGLQHPPRPPDV